MTVFKDLLTKEGVAAHYLNCCLVKKNRNLTIPIVVTFLNDAGVIFFSSTFFFFKKNDVLNGLREKVVDQSLGVIFPCFGRMG